MEQKVAVWIDDTAEWKSVVANGIKLAKILAKDLLVLQGNVKGKVKVDRNQQKEEVQSYLDTFDFSYPIEFFQLSDKFETYFDHFAKELEVLVYVFPKSIGKTMLSLLKTSPTPFLFVSQNSDLEKSFQNILVPVGYMAKAKDSALWASYIARYNKTEVTLLSATEPDSDDQHDVNAHVDSIENLYEKFGFPFQNVQSEKATWRIQEDALKQARQSNSGLLILSGTQQISLLDSLLPLPEKKLLKHSADIPVIFVNSQREMYVLCG